jgi:hypothetical protein
MNKFGVLCACLVALLLANASSAAPAASFVGIWYGVGEPDDPDIFYIDAYKADGTFNSEYRKCEKGKLVYQQTQSGKWSVADGVLTMHSDTINGKPERYDHFYTVESLTQNEFRVRFSMPDFLFVETRIPAFEFPPCYLGA